MLLSLRSLSSLSVITTRFIILFSGTCKEVINFNYVARRWIEEASSVVDIMEDVGIAVAAADSTTTIAIVSIMLYLPHFLFFCKSPERYTN